MRAAAATRRPGCGIVCAPGHQELSRPGQGPRAARTTGPTQVSSAAVARMHAHAASTASAAPAQAAMVGARAAADRCYRQA